MGRLAISELTTLRWSFEQDIEHYQAAGAQAIGVWRPKLADIGDEKGAALLAESGLAVSSLQWAGGFTGSEGRSHQESLADARQAIASAAAIGAGCLILHSGARGSHTHNHARRLFRQALDKLVPLAEERGVVLAVEPMNGDCGGEFTFLNCFDETLELVATYNSDALGVALDTYYWGHQPGFLQRLSSLAPRLALVQLGDALNPPQSEPNRCQLGDGTIPLRQFVQQLTAAGYNGFYEIELMGEEIEAAGYRDVISRAVEMFQSWMVENEVGSCTSLRSRPRNAGQFHDGAG
jgi:sugar phosphate isomerase/epimerase